MQVRGGRVADRNRFSGVPHVMLTRRRRNEHGAAAVEFALVLPLLMLFLFGIITFGIVFAQNLALGNGARQAARLGAVEGNTCQEIWVEARENAISVGMDGDDVTVDVSRVGTGPALANCDENTAVQPCEDSDPGQSIRVELTFPSEVMLPVPGAPDEIDVEGTGEFRCEFS